MAYGKSPVSRSHSPFDDYAPERLRRMGLLTEAGKPNRDAMAVVSRLYAGLFYEHLRGFYSDTERVESICRDLADLIGAADTRQSFLSICSAYDAVYDSLPETVWWMAGNLELAGQFRRRLSQMPCRVYRKKWGDAMTRTIKVYVPPGQTGPLGEFLPVLDEKLRRKLLRQIFRLSQIHLCELKEPHFKHFVLEKYNQLYELREKSKVLARIIFTIRDGDIILLAPFIKHQPRDTMKALDQSLRMLADIRNNPKFAVNMKWEEFL